MKNTTKPKKTPKNIYVISWAAVDTCEPGSTSSGTFTNIFSTKKKARQAVMDEVASLAAQDLDAYDTEKDKIDALGTADVRELAEKMVKLDQGMYVECENEAGIVTQFGITKYCLDYLK